MRFRHFLPCCLLAAALASCIGDEAPNKEAAIDACTGTDVQFTNAMASSRGFNIYVNRGADLAAQYLTFTIPEGATIATREAAEGDTPFTPNEDGSYSATLNFDNDGFNRLLTVTSEDGANQVTYLIQLIQMELPVEFHFERLQETSQAYHILLEEEAMTTDGLQRILQWCSGNPGKMEYRGVYLPTGKQIFHYGPVYGTNNIGEFLAIVHALALLKQKGLDMPVYSDSVNAISWVKQKKCKTKLPRNERTEALFQMIERAEKWLRENAYATPIRKWETEKWGEVPADFGRK